MSSLKRDSVTVSGLNWACLSFVGNLDGKWVRPVEGSKHDEFMIKIRGAFSTQEEADKHAKKLQEVDNSVDIYVVSLYEWLLIPPPPISEIENVNYTDERLQAIMQGYKDNQKNAAIMFEKRKEEMNAKPMGEPSDRLAYVDPGDENSKYYNKPDEKPIPHPSELVEKFKVEYPDKSQEELVKMADEEVQNVIKEREAEREKARKTEEKGKGKAE